MSKIAELATPTSATFVDVLCTFFVSGPGTIECGAGEGATPEDEPTNATIRSNTKSEKCTSVAVLSASYVQKSQMSKIVELATPVRLSLVCFTHFLFPVRAEVNFERAEAIPEDESINETSGVIRKSEMCNLLRF